MSKKFQSPHGDSFYSDGQKPARRKYWRRPFQSPHGDSFYSDRRGRRGRSRPGGTFQSPHGDSFYSDHYPRIRQSDPRRRFQSPHGDSFYSDTYAEQRIPLLLQSFNPLTGIRSILTRRVIELMEYHSGEFQSPHGDSFYSDFLHDAIRKQRVVARFNPLTGIRSFLTVSACPERANLFDSFNPLTGIRSFLTSNAASAIRWARGKFQSPYGDSFFSD